MQQYLNLIKTWAVVVGVKWEGIGVHEKENSR